MIKHNFNVVKTQIVNILLTSVFFRKGFHMFDYVFEMYIHNGREYFVYGEREGTLTRRDFPFPQSLLLLLDLNVVEIDKVTHRVDRLIERYYQEQDAEIEAQIIAGLEQLAAMHIFFAFLPLDWKVSCDNRAVWLY